LIPKNNTRKLVDHTALLLRNCPFPIWCPQSRTLGRGKQAPSFGSRKLFLFDIGLNARVKKMKKKKT